MEMKEFNSWSQPNNGKNLPAEILEFNDELKVFATKLSYISALETGGKLPPDLAYQEVKQLWKHLKKRKKQLLNHRNSA